VDLVLSYKLRDDGCRFRGVRAIVLNEQFDLFAVDPAGAVDFIGSHLDAVDGRDTEVGCAAG